MHNHHIARALADAQVAKGEAIGATAPPRPAPRIGLRPWFRLRTSTAS